MKNKTPKNLIVIGAVAIMLFGAARTTYAYVPGVWDPQPRVQTNEPTFIQAPIEYDAPVQRQVVEAQEPYTYYYSPTPVPPKTQTRTITRTVYVDQNGATVQQGNLPPVVENPTNSTDNNGLTALSFQGNGGFFPSSIWQWILVVLLIFAVVVIARSFKKEEHPHVPAH